MIYLYGLIEAPSKNLEDELKDTAGLEGPLKTVLIGQWGLVYSEHGDDEILPKRRLLLAHTKVLEKMIALGTILPARFGLVADTLDHVGELIAAKSAIITQEFDRVRGCVELGVRVLYPRQSALDATLAQDAALSRERDRLAGKGREAHFAMAEFGGRLADQLDRRRSGAQKMLLSDLVSRSRSHVLRAPEEDTEVLRAEFLVPAHEQDSFVTAVEAATHDLTFAPGAEPSIQIVGPVPMYNFVRLSLAFDMDEEAA